MPQQPGFAVLQILPVQQVLEGNFLKIIVNNLIEPLPHRQRHALVGPLAAALAAFQAGHRGKGTLCQL